MQKQQEKYTAESKLISLVLRHQPERFGLKLGTGGFVPVEALLKGMKGAGMPITEAQLREIVETDRKRRYSFSPDETGIRANYGHSVPVELSLPAAEPPETLYHGTKSAYLDSILREGILKMQRQTVCLSVDRETAQRVGDRHRSAHSSTVILQVDAGRMFRDGFVFYCTDSNVWLTDHVPREYLQIT